MDKNYGSPGPAFEEHPVNPSTSARDTLTIQLFGSITVHRNGTVLGAGQLGGTKPRQILAILAVYLGTPVSKHRLIELLWADHPPAEAVSTLESYVCVLRRHLQPGAGKAGPLQTTTGGYLLDRRLVRVDRDRFGSLLSEAHRATPENALRHLDDALDLAAAPLLEDELTLPWATDERDRHASVVTATQVRASETAAALGLTEQSIALARAALKDDPLNEGAWTTLVLGLERAGRPTEGLQRYERYRRLLGQELGCCPSPVLRDAHARLLRATEDDEGELANVVAALVFLHDGPRGTQNSPLSVRESLTTAGGIVDAFLRRALASMC